MRTTLRFLLAAAASLTLAACGDAPVAPASASDAPASLAMGDPIEHVSFDNRYNSIFFARLPCGTDGAPGEFVRVSGEWHVWGRGPADPYVGDAERMKHHIFHGAFAGTGSGITTRRTFDVTIRELDAFNGPTDYGIVHGTANWRARVTFVDVATGERLVESLLTRLVITPNGDIVVDEMDWGGCEP